MIEPEAEQNIERAQKRKAHDHRLYAEIIRTKVPPEFERLGASAAEKRDLRIIIRPVAAEIPDIYSGYKRKSRPEHPIAEQRGNPAARFLFQESDRER